VDKTREAETMIIDLVEDFEDLFNLYECSGHKTTCALVEHGAQSCTCGRDRMLEAVVDASISPHRRGPRMRKRLKDLERIFIESGRVFGHVGTCDDDPCTCGAGDLARSYEIDVDGAHIMGMCVDCGELQDRSRSSCPSKDCYSGLLRSVRVSKREINS